MKKFNILTGLAFALLCIPAGHAAQTEKPAISFHSNAYKEVGESNLFSLMLGVKEKTTVTVDYGFTRKEVEISPAYFDQEAGEMIGTMIPCHVDEEGWVKIYGDPSLFDVIDFEGGYITDIDFSDCLNLEILGLEHNSLRSLDLTPFTRLQAIYLSDNPFTPSTPLVVGAPKAGLQILELDLIDHLDSGFNLSDYPALVTFDGYHTRSITKIDPSGCPNLLVLSLEMTDVSELDVSKNVNLRRLNISETQISEIDLSKNVALEYLIANHASGTINTEHYLRNIDLSHNTSLTLLNLGGNRLQSVDLSKNTRLTNLVLSRNNLTSIDLSKNRNLYSVDLMLNYMDFATLPLPENTWGEYYYSQHPVKVDRSLAVGAPLDLSAKVLRKGTETQAIVVRKPYGMDPEPLDESAYSYADGVVTFNKAVNDSVYVLFGNSAFIEYPLQTTPFMVKDASEIGKPSGILSFSVNTSAGRSVSFAAGMDGATPDAPGKFFVDMGDGKLTEFQTTFSMNPSAPNVSFDLPSSSSGYVTVYVPEGDVLTAFDIQDVALYSIDVNRATELRNLTVAGCGLYSIDLSYNRCLQTLDISRNSLYYVDLGGIYGGYEKNVLSEINASHNEISTFKVVSTGSVKSLDLSYNNLKEYSLKDYDFLTRLNLSHNQLEGSLNVAYLADATEIDLSHNSLSSLEFDSFSSLSRLDISGNNFTLETVPYLPEAGDAYIYAPQQKLRILENAPAVNLSAQNRVIDGKGTEFVWKTVEGATLVEGTDFNCKDGSTTFLRPDLGKVYCEMTNPAFPAFSGADVFSTTDVNVVGRPTTVVARFTTTGESEMPTVTFTGSKSTSLFIDWRGDGSEFLPYPVETSYKAYPVENVYKNAEVTVYTYDDPADITVFSVSGIKMSSFDGSRLTKAINLSVNGGYLDQSHITFPETSTLREISLADNLLDSYPFDGRYPDLYMLNLSGNNFTEFDASGLKNVGCLYLSRNNLTSVTFDNPQLWDLALDNNPMETVDLNGLPALSQLGLASCRLSEIDLSPVAKTLYGLSIVGNRFTFATLPRPEDYPGLRVYYYGLQSLMDVASSDGVVDLSAQAMVGAAATDFVWFLGVPTVNEDTGEYEGPRLQEGVDYTIENGVTTFLRLFDEDVMCMMTNTVYPNLILFTYPFRSDVASAASVEAGDAPVDVYSAGGTLVKRGVDPAEALDGLEKGIYIVGGRKVLVK